MAGTYELAGREYPITGYEKIKDKDGNVLFAAHVIDLPMVSDYEWQLDCLKSRLEHPERYAAFEDVYETIEHLRRWLLDHKDKMSIA